MTEYGFKGFQDAFDALAAEKGEEVLGVPLAEAFYLGTKVVFQAVANGLLIAIKLDDDTWTSQFHPKA